MIQLITDLPFDLSTVESLKKEWTRFQDGLVGLSEIPDAVREVFECEAEIIPQNEEDEVSTLSVNDFVPSGKGKLILTVSKLYWLKPESEDVGSSMEPRGWSVDYKNVLLHAISKPNESRPYIYLQLSCNKIVDHQGNQVDFRADEEDGDEEDEKFVEVNLFVGSESVADEMFVALSECASLYPCDSESDASEQEHEQEDEVEVDNKKCKIDHERFEDAAEN